MTLHAFQLRSLGTLPLGENRTSTASATFATASGGVPNDLSSVRLFYIPREINFELTQAKIRDKVNGSGKIKQHKREGEGEKESIIAE